MPNPKPYTATDGTVTWRVRFRLEGRNLSETFDTRAEAEKFCREVELIGSRAAVDRLYADGGSDGSPTLDEWAETHFAALTEPSGASVHRYRRVYAEAWQPTLGHLPLTQITRSHVATALNAVGGSDKTRKNKWAVLTHMFKTATQDGLIPRSPAVGIKLGVRTDHEREEHRYLSIGEFSAILAATPVHWRPLVLTLAGTGIRWGEAAALTVGDVVGLEPAGAVLRITKAEKADPDHPGRVVVGPTKTRRSRRTIALPSEVVAALEPLLEGRKRTERLFLPPKGGPLRHRTFYRDIWLRKSCAGSGIDEPYPRLHDLRHSHVAWLIGEGVQLPVIQARLGHEKITTTIDTYGHLLPDIQRAATEAADTVLRGVVLPPDPKELTGPLG